MTGRHVSGKVTSGLHVDMFGTRWRKADVDASQSLHGDRKGRLVLLMSLMSFGIQDVMTDRMCFSNSLPPCVCSGRLR